MLEEAEQTEAQDNGSVDFQKATLSELIGHILDKHYTVPPDGCLSYRTLYQALEAFELDLHQHIAKATRSSTSVISSS